jgi:hypothetical protein
MGLILVCMLILRMTVTAQQSDPALWSTKAQERTPNTSIGFVPELLTRSICCTSMQS